MPMGARMGGQMTTNVRNARLRWVFPAMAIFVFAVGLVVPAWAATGGDVPGATTPSGPEPTDDYPRTTEPVPDAPDRVTIESIPLDESEVKATQDYNGVDRTEAVARLRLELAVSGLDRRLMEQLGEREYAGHWLTRGSRAEVVVGVIALDGNDLDDKRERIAAGFPYPERLRVEAAEVSWKSLVDAYQGVSADWASYSVALGDSVVAHYATDDIAITGVGIRPSINSLSLVATPRRQMSELEARRAAQTAGDDLARDYGLPTPHVDVGEPTEDCTRADCRWTMRGGLRLYWNDLYCTSAFSAVSRTSSQRHVLSAGHCSGSWRRNGPSGHYGQVSYSRNQANTDVARITHSTNPWSSQGYVFVSSSDVRPIDLHMSYHGYSEGVQVGMAGGRSGTTRGHITDAYYSQGSYWDFVRADYVRRGSDSGASIFRNNTAFGIHKGSPTGALSDAMFGRIEPAMHFADVWLIAAP